MLRGFYVGTLPDAGSRPVVVHRGDRVLDANAAARRLGAHPGQPLAEARAILGSEGSCVAWDPEAYREAQRRWLEIAAEFSDRIEPLAPHEALVDLTGHPRPREAAERLGEALRSRLGAEPKIGVGACRWVARHAAREGDPLGLAHADPAAFVAPLEPGSLPIPRAHAERLELLGYRSAGEIAALDLATLRAQFDEDALLIARAAKGGGRSNVEPLFPPRSLAARFAFETPPETREALQTAGYVLAQGIGAGLRGEDAAGRRVDLFLEMEDATVVPLSRTFARAIATADDLEAALRLMLGERSEGPPLALQPPLALRVRMPELEPTRRVQLDLRGVRSIDDSRASARAAVENVRQAFGPEVVVLGSERATPRWVQVRRAYARVNGWAWI